MFGFLGQAERRQKEEQTEKLSDAILLLNIVHSGNPKDLAEHLEKRIENLNRNEEADGDIFDPYAGL